MKPLSEKTKTKLIPWAIFIGLLILFTILFNSCSVQSEFSKQEKRLCTPDYKTYIITHVDSKTVYLLSYPDSSQTREERNSKYFNEKVGDLMLMPIYSYNNEFK